MGKDSAANIGAIGAAVCGTAAIAGYLSRERRRKRDREKLQEMLDSIDGNVEIPMAKQANISSFVRANSKQLGSHGLGLIRENAATDVIHNPAHMVYNTMRGVGGVTQRSLGLVSRKAGMVE